MLPIVSLEKPEGFLREINYNAGEPKMRLIRAPDDLVNKLRDACKSEGKSLSDYVTEILERAVAPPSVKKLEEQPEEDVSEKTCLFKMLEERIERLDSVRKREVAGSLPKELGSKEAEVYRLAVSGRGVEEIGLRLLMDPVEVQRILKFLVDGDYLDEYLRATALS